MHHINNSPIDLQALRFKLNIIKTKNNSFIKKNKRCLKSLNFTKNESYDRRKSSSLVNDEENAIVENCFEKSRKLIEKRNKLKKLKKMDKCLMLNHSNFSKLDFHKKHRALSSSEEIEIVRENTCFSLTQSSTLNQYLREKPLNKHILNSNGEVTTLRFRAQTSKKDKGINGKNISDKSKVNHVMEKSKCNSLVKSCSSLTSNSKNLLHNPDIFIVENEEIDDSDITFIKVVSNSDKIKPITDAMNEDEFASFGLYTFSSTNLVKNKDSSIKNQSLSVEKETFSKKDDIEIDEELDTVLPVLDFSEEPVDFAVPELHKKERIFYTKEDMGNFLSNGIAIKTGKWSKAEEALLHRNFNNFVAEFGINDVCLLLGIGRRISSNKQEYSQILRFLKAKHFLLRIGKELDTRTLKCIYNKARHFLDPNRKKKISLEDVPSIFQLHQKYGNQWNLISKKTGFTNANCKKYCSYYQNRCANGKWTDNENEKLINAIKKVSKLSDLSNKDIKGISWSKVADLVQSRNAKQCSTRWHMTLAKEQSRAKYLKWDRKCNAKLVSLLKKDFLVDDEADINWEEVYKFFKNVAPSLFYLRFKWNVSLKMRTPKVFKKNYSDLLNYLYEKYCKDVKSK